MRLFITPKSKKYWHVIINDTRNIVRAENYEAVATACIGYNDEIDVYADFHNIEKSRSVVSTTQQYIKYFKHYEEYKNVSYPGLDNYFENIQKVITSPTRYFSIDSVKKLVENRPVVYCGAGPSIQEVLPELKSLADAKRAVLVAGGSGIRVLLNAGIKPDIAIAIDPYKSEWDNVFAQISPEMTSNTILICKPDLEPRSFDLWRGPVVVGGGHDGLPGLAKIVDIPDFDCGLAGVSTAFMSLITQCCPFSIYLAGVDLCYGLAGEDAKHYADSNEIKNSDSMIEAHGFNTRLLWIQESEIIAMLANKVNARVFRLGSPGKVLPISNTEYINTVTEYATLTDISIDEYCLTNILDIDSIKERADNIIQYFILNTPDVRKSSGFYTDRDFFLPWHKYQLSRKAQGFGYDTDFMRQVAENLLENIERTFNV